MKKALMILAVVAVVATGCNKETQAPQNGTENGHEWVDLGLPSGTLWATCNIGAATPEAYGDYFAWGETTAKEIYNWSNYKYANGAENKLTKYCNSSVYGDNGFTDGLTTLLLEDDAATANWGGAWRMPTADEMRELRDNCSHTSATQNGVEGHLYTAKNGNSLFLPAAGLRYDAGSQDVGSDGYYWSSSIDTNNAGRVWRLSFGPESYSMITRYRCYGYTMRPVCPAQH